MRLVYKNDQLPVAVGQPVKLDKLTLATIVFFREPHKPSSEGKVCIRVDGEEHDREVYVSVIGAEWIEREDREEKVLVNEIDQRIIDGHADGCKERAKIELAVVRKVIAAFREAGLPVVACDGQDRTSVNATDDQLVDHLFGVDESHLISGRSWVWFVFGNDGYDVIADYSIDLERMIEPVENWIDETYPY